jgi:hypothetical protein
MNVVVQMLWHLPSTRLALLEMDPYQGAKAHSTPAADATAAIDPVATEQATAASTTDGTLASSSSSAHGGDHPVTSTTKEEEDYAYALSLAEDLSVERELGAALQEVLLNLALAAKNRSKSSAKVEESNDGVNDSAGGASPGSPLHEASSAPTTITSASVAEEAATAPTNEKRSKKRGKGSSAPSTTSNSHGDSNPDNSSNSNNDNSSAAARVGSVVVEVGVKEPIIR